MLFLKPAVHKRICQKDKKHRNRIKHRYENWLSAAVYNKDYTTTGKLHNYRNKTWNNDIAM